MATKVPRTLLSTRKKENLLPHTYQHLSNEESPCPVETSMSAGQLTTDVELTSFGGLALYGNNATSTPSKDQAYVQVDAASDFDSPAISRPLTLHGKLTTYVLATGTASIIALLGAITSISLLWFLDESNATWAYIVQENLLTRSVTLLAQTLRTAISIQAGIATSMLASLAIESSGVDVLPAIDISSARASNSGPLSLLTTYSKMRDIEATSLDLLLYTSILAVSTVALQFSSTLLLTDISLGTKTSSTSQFNTTFGFPWLKWMDSMIIAKALGEKHVDVLLDIHPSFGELRISDRTRGVIDDTGSVIRSFMPLNNQSDRESLRSYNGPALAIDSRVACTQPEFISLSPCEDGSEELKLCGTVKPRHTKIPNSVLNSTGVPFECALPKRYWACEMEDAQPIRECEDPAWTICWITETIAHESAQPVNILTEPAGGLMSNWGVAVRREKC